MERTVALILMTLVMSGCASVTRGTSEVFVIESTPPNARATLSTGISCTTPCSIKVPRRGDFDVTFELDGYQTVHASVTSNIDGNGTAGLAGNVLFGGIIGAGIDAGTGAMQSHEPNPLQVLLIPVDASPEDSAAEPEGAQPEQDGREAANSLAEGESTE